MTADGFGAGERFQAALGKGSLKMGRPSENSVSDSLFVDWVVNPTNFVGFKESLGLDPTYACFQ